MSLLQDAKHAFLRTATALEGHVNDLEVAWLISLGATGGTVHDLWSSLWDNAAIPPGQHNDRAMVWLAAQGAVGDQYNDRWLSFWQGGGAPPPLVPPAFGNVQHWFDFTDGATVFSNFAGTTPSVPGGAIRYVANKGIDGTPATTGDGDATTVTLLDGPNGLTIGRSVDSLESLSLNHALPGGATGAAYAMVVRANQAMVATRNILAWGGMTTNMIANAQGPSPAPWQFRITGGAFITSPKVVIADEWVSIIVSKDGGTQDYFSRVSGTAELDSSPSAYSAVGFPGPGMAILSTGNDDVELGELIIWDRALTLSERDAAEAYFDAKYGTLPFLGLPSTVVDLIHHFDFTDNTTVFKNPPATQLALDGDFIRQVSNKGSDGTPINSASDGVSPILRTGVINGLQIADCDGFSKLLDGIVAAGHSSSTLGLSMAIVFRWISGVSATNPMAGWENNLSRTTPIRHGQFFVQGAPGAVHSLAPLGSSQWYMGMFAFDAAGLAGRWQFSGEALQTAGLGFLTDVTPGSTIEIGNAGTLIQVAEVAFWDGQLSVAEITDLFDYADEKYGTLPSPAPLLPPFLANLQHWWDFTDAAAVWADTAAAMPITDGTIIQRVDDKGTAADDLLDAGSGITWHTGVVNGLSVARNTVVQAPSRFTSQALTTLIGTLGGVTYSSVKRHFNVPGGQGIMHAIDNGPSEVTQESGFGSWSEDHPNSGTTPSNKAVVINEWVSHDMSDDGPSGYIQHVSGAADVTGLANFAIQTGTPVEIFAQSVDGEIGEILVYDRGLTAAELLTLQAYYDAKYLALPHT